MSKAMRMVWMNVLLSYRVKIAFFFTFVFPMIFFFVYFSFFAHGSSTSVEAFMGPLISFSVISNALFGLSAQLVAMRERDMLRRYHLAPLTSADMVVSRLLSNYLLFLPVIVLQYVLAVWLYHMPVHGSLLALWLVITLGYAALGAIGLVVAGIVDTVQEATVWNQIIFFALLFLTGTTMPLAFLPHLVQQIALFMPPTLMILGSGAIMLGGQGVAQNWQVIVGLLLVAIACTGLGISLFRWEKDTKTTSAQRRRAALALIPLLAVGIWLNTSPSFQQIGATYAAQVGAAFSGASH